MIITEKRTRPQTEYDYTVGVQCGLCKKTVDGAKQEFTGIDWCRADYEKSTTCVQMEEGAVWPEGGTIHITEARLCPDCMKRVFELLKEIGTDIETREVDL